MPNAGGRDRGHRTHCPAGHCEAISREGKIGCIPQTLREWVKKTEKDSGMRDGMTTEVRIKDLEREVW